MKKRILSALLSVCLIAGVCCAVAFAANSKNASGMYYTAVNASEININKAGKYVVKLKTFDEPNAGWEWNVPTGTDVTSWFFNEHGAPAFKNNSGIAIAARKDTRNLEITIDTSKIAGFTYNGSFELRLNPSAGTPLVPDANNHGQYKPEIDAVYVGRVTIPSLTVDGRIEMENQSMTKDSTVIKLEMDGLEDGKIDSSKASVKLIEGDGYLLSDFAKAFPDHTLTGSWSGGKKTYTIKSIDAKLSPLGGSGNGEYNINLGITGLKYDGLPLADGLIRVHLYSFGRTFTIETYGSLIYDTQPRWGTEAADGVPVLCDPYPDYLTAVWPIGFDASGLTADDFTLTMRGKYEIDDLTLKPGTDYTVSYANNQTTIVLAYQYWANLPVYTSLNVDVKLDHLKWDKEKYHPEVTGISHSYDIASVYAYFVMSGGPSGPQSWTFYGIGLDSFLDVFHEPNYILSVTGSDGSVQYYAEDAAGKAYLTTSADEAKNFKDLRPEIAYVKGNTATFVRQFDVTEDVEINGKVYKMDRQYETAETLLENAAYGLANGVTAEPGYAIGETWAMHERWPWQTFIGTGYMGGSK